MENISAIKIINSELFISVGFDGFLRFFDSADPSRIFEKYTVNLGVPSVSMAFDSVRNFVFTGDILGSIKVFDMGRLQVIHEMDSHSEFISSLHLHDSPNQPSSMLISTSYDKKINVVDKNCSPVRSMNIGTRVIASDYNETNGLLLSSFNYYSIVGIDEMITGKTSPCFIRFFPKEETREVGTLGQFTCCGISDDHLNACAFGTSYGAVLALGHQMLSPNEWKAGRYKYQFIHQTTLRWPDSIHYPVNKVKFLGSVPVSAGSDGKLGMWAFRSLGSIFRTFQISKGSRGISAIDIDQSTQRAIYSTCYDWRNGMVFPRDNLAAVGSIDL